MSSPVAAWNIFLQRRMRLACIFLISTAPAALTNHRHAYMLAVGVTGLVLCGSRNGVAARSGLARVPTARNAGNARTFQRTVVADWVSLPVSGMGHAGVARQHPGPSLTIANLQQPDSPIPRQLTHLRL